MAVVEEPELREDQGESGQHPCHRLEEEDERNEPDEVLRREEPGEGEEACDRRGKGKSEAPRIVAAAQIEPRDRHDGQNLCDRAQHGQRLRQRADEIVRDRVPGAMHDRGAVEAQPVGDGEQRAAEALDLQRASSLRAEALGEPVRRSNQERNDEESGDHSGREQSTPGRPTAARTPDEDHGGRNEHDGVDLGRERATEQGERGYVPARQQQRECSDGEQRRPRVVGVERDRAERERGQREEQDAGPEASHRHSEPREQGREQKERRNAAQSHQALERGVVVRRPEGRRRQEHRHGPRRILHEEVAVRYASVEDGVREPLIEVDVSETLSA